VYTNNFLKFQEIFRRTFLEIFQFTTLTTSHCCWWQWNQQQLHLVQMNKSYMLY